MHGSVCVYLQICLTRAPFAFFRRVYASVFDLFKLALLREKKLTSGIILLLWFYGRSEACITAFMDAINLIDGLDLLHCTFPSPSAGYCRTPAHANFYAGLLIECEFNIFMLRILWYKCVHECATILYLQFANYVPFCDFKKCLPINGRSNIQGTQTNVALFNFRCAGKAGAWKYLFHRTINDYSVPVMNIWSLTSIL